MTVGDYLPREHRSYARVMNPMRDDDGQPLAWWTFAAERSEVDATTKWTDGTVYRSSAIGAQKRGKCGDKALYLRVGQLRIAVVVGGLAASVRCNPGQSSAGELRFLRRPGNCERVTYCVSSADAVTGKRVWVLADSSVVVMVSRGTPPAATPGFSGLRYP
jgi:hypothetical protein